MYVHVCFLKICIVRTYACDLMSVRTMTYKCVFHYVLYFINVSYYNIIDLYVCICAFQVFL